VSHKLKIGMVALLCTMLCGLGRAQIDASSVTQPNYSEHHQNSDSISGADVTGPRFQKWKSCIDQFHRDGFHSVLELQSMFQEPHDVRELLRNLKLAWSQDLLLQPAFYDPGVLKRFFAGTAVTWKEPRNPLTEGVGYVVGEVDRTVIPGGAIRVETRCWQIDVKSKTGGIKSTAELHGFISLTGGPFSGMTLRVIRDVFGSETRNEIDYGGVEFGVVYGPTTKGRVTYVDQLKEQSEGVALGTTFVFPYQPAQTDPKLSSKLIDDDVAQSVEMHEAAHRIQEK
jgi:hypothetical protein